MAELRQRKPVEPTPASKPEAEDKPKTRNQKRDGPDLEPSLAVMISLLTAFVGAIVLLFTYKESNAQNGAFAGYINARFPAVEKLLNRAEGGGPLFGAAAQDVPASLPALTEADLAAYDGTDPDLPLLLAINGTIYDVSASPSFYGPGSHYHHFVGRDASRAWVTECWDTPDQFTWRMDGVEAMFAPTWLDEQLEAAAAGTLDAAILADLPNVPSSMIANMAKKAIEKFGTVSEEERAERRVEDKKEAELKVQETLGKWVKFFSGSEKYKVYGTVILDESRPDPPAPCAEAMKKRAIKGGKLESMMGTLGKMMGGGKDGKKKEGAQMPDFVKQQLEKAKAKLGKDGKDETPAKKSEKAEEVVHEEL